MSKERWDREREALRRLARVLAEEARGGLLEEALEVVLESTRAEAGAAFAVHGTAVEMVAERGLGKPSARGGTGRSKHPVLPDLRSPVTTAARRAAAGRKGVYLVDLAEPRADAERRDDFLAHGFRSLLARALKHQRQVHGVLVLVSKDASLFDPSRLGFVETVSHMVGLAAECGKRTERELDYRSAVLEIGRNSALGSLTAAAARELKAPVGALNVQLTTEEEVLGRLREAGTDWAQPMVGELFEILADTKVTLAQISAITGQLSAVAQPGEGTGRVDFSEVTRDTMSLVRAELRRRGLGVTEDYAPSCLTTGRRDQLVQVILTLVFQAAAAAMAAAHPRPGIVVRTGIDGSRVVLSIEDTGSAVPAEDLAVLFQPFAIKREGGRGAGLGLSICSDLVANHHGRVEATNLEQGGACFRVVLPRVIDATAEDSARLGTTQPPPKEAADLRRILIVDDDELLTRTVKRALRPHEVRVAGIASEAEIALLDPTYSPHLVLCGLALPGMTGDMLHGRILAKRPEVAKKFVFLTADASNQREAEYLGASGCTVLQKPLDLAQIWSLLNLQTPIGSSLPARSSSLPARTSSIPAEPMMTRSQGPRNRSDLPTRRPH